MRVRRALLLALAAVAPAAGFSADPEALLAAATRAPAVEAARRRIDAAQARLSAAGRLADPQVEAMGSRVNGRPAGDDRSMWELNVRQPLPRRGERAADRDRATAAISMAEAEFAFAAGEAAAEVAVALAEAEGARARAALIDTQQRRLGAVLASLDARLAAGASVRLADRLTLQTRAAALELSLEEARRTAADAEAAARSRLSLAPDAPLPVLSMPDPASIRAQESPGVALAEARAAEASAMGRVARAGAAPMTSVGLRLERERGAAGSQDTIGVAFASDLPFRARDYARAGGRAAEAERASARADAESARQRVTNALGRAERAERFAETARRLTNETQLRLEAEHDALNRAVSVGAASGMAGESAVLHAVDILDRTTETQLRIIEAETAARISRAELWRHLATPRLLRLAAASPPSP